jgi:ComF family protein
MAANVVRGALNSVVTLLFPSDCRLCGLPLASSSLLPVCAECLESLQPISGERCLLCGERLFSGITNLCGECLTERPPYVKASAYGSYDGGLRELIHLLKYEHVKPAANVLGRMLAEAVTDIAPQFDEKNLPLVVPVPLHATKLRQRGFNQAELIARAMAKLQPAGLNLQLAPELLLRKRATESQVGYTRQQRLANLRGAFMADGAVRGRDILLIDDVFTTGTTASECTRVLRRAGAANVWVGTVARVLKFEQKFESTLAMSELDREALAMAARA